MNRLLALHFVCLVLVFTSQAVFYAGAQEQDYHVFTDKKGQTTEARLLTISPGKTKLGIQLKDGRKFEIPILTLSLDDQQFVKGWLKSNPDQPGYRIEFKFDKHLNDKGRFRHSSGNSWITQKVVYDLVFKNLSRETLKGATLEYYALIEHGIYVSPDPDPDTGEPIWSVYNPDNKRMKRGRMKKPNRAEPSRPVSLTHGKVKLNDLRKNYSITAQTKELQLREIHFDGGGTYGSDKIIGIIAHLADASSQEIGTYRSIDSPIQDVSWEQVTQMPPGDPSGAPLP